MLFRSRMFMANLGGLAVSMGIPTLVKYFADKGSQVTEGQGAMPSDSHAWFMTMLIYSLAGLFFLIFCFTQTKEKVVMNEAESANVKVSDLWTEFLRNRPLRILAFFFITAFAMMSIGNAAGSYYMQYNMNATTSQMSLFMGLGSIPDRKSVV